MKDPIFEGMQIPAIVAPMFIISNPKMALACCQSGLVGSFPVLNQRSSEDLEQWLIEMNEGIAALKAKGNNPAPWGVNLIVHLSEKRVMVDFKLCVKHKVPIIFTALGINKDLVDAVHAYGGKVFHDVTTTRHARSAAKAGVDGLTAVCAGAGGHGGQLNPLAFISEIREFFDGFVLVGGCVSNGAQIAALQMLGADLAYIGTRFINVQEASTFPGMQDMCVESGSADVLYTDKFSGINANVLRPSVIQAGLDPDNLEHDGEVNLGEEFSLSDGPKAWTDIWTAGQGVGATKDTPTTEELCQRLKQEYFDALEFAKGLSGAA